MSSGFVSETELAERRRVRQEEWEKVRTAEQPLEAPEEQYDHRSLFDRLEEQRRKKEYEYEETHKLKNMIRGLDDDEVDFLELVDRTKMAEERRQLIEEAKQIEEFRSKVLDLQCESSILPLKTTVSKPSTISSSIVKKTQSKLLAGAIIKKRSSEESTSGSKKQMINHESIKLNVKHNEKSSGNVKSSLLPGIAYSDSSDSDEDLLNYPVKTLEKSIFF
ncbi:PSME3-interacting protein isoform X2 [Daktulosphaira vitifoliae]|uniref:PSME3-interacting protein isoform X2 n=1 Tax=Daktulosphaira vitifoliae TaxID=58002 RepID=UPI0021AA946B|nr:PSME3-interacting protein isoform X2 [Daktulosphaira vitifoliae]